MSQYSSRLLMLVNSPSQWKILQQMDLTPYNISSPAKDVFQSRKKQILIADDWACSEAKLTKLVKEIIKRVKNCVIIADTTDYNVNPFEYGVYYFGSKVGTFHIDEPDPGFDMFSTVDITDVSGWISASGCEISSVVKRYLAGFGIQCEINKTKTEKAKEYSVRFFVADESLDENMAKCPYINPNRCLQDVLEERGRDLFASIGDNEASFEIPKQTEAAITNYTQELSKHFSSVCAVAWDGKKEEFDLYSVKSDGVYKISALFSDLGLHLGENIFDDSLWDLAEVVDIQKIRQLLV